MLQAVDARNKSAHDEEGSDRVGLGRRFNHFPQSPGAHSMIPRAFPRDVRLAYAPFGAARGRALRAYGPAFFLADASFAAARDLYLH